MVIALVGLAVVGIPFLTVMGVGAAGTVLVAVLVALTLLPGAARLRRARLAPRPGSRAARREQADAAGRRAPAARWAPAGPGWSPGGRCSPSSSGWRASLVLAVPAPQLQLALPDNSTAAPDSPQRQAYDLISEHFGPGLNGPLVVLVEDLDPATAQQTAGAIAAAIGGTPTGTPGEFSGGLDDVAYAARPCSRRHDRPRHGDPRERPAGGGDQPAGRRPARGRPRPRAADRRRLAVTGQTAVAIDVSDRLGQALLPFALVVVGLALILLLLVVPLDPRADQGRGRASCSRSAPRSARSSPSSSGAGWATCSACRRPAR